MTNITFKLEIPQISVNASCPNFWTLQGFLWCQRSLILSDLFEQKKISDLFSLLSCLKLALPFSNLFPRQNIFRFAFFHFKFIFCHFFLLFFLHFSRLFSLKHHHSIPTMPSLFPRRGVIAVAFYFFLEFEFSCHHNLQQPFLQWHRCITVTKNTPSNKTKQTKKSFKES